MNGGLPRKRPLSHATQYLLPQTVSRTEYPVPVFEPGVAIYIQIDQVDTGVGIQAVQILLKFCARTQWQAGRAEQLQVIEFEAFQAELNGPDDSLNECPIAPAAGFGVGDKPGIGKIQPEVRAACRVVMDNDRSGVERADELAHCGPWISG